ncbi:MAG: NADH-quinone oxidoreductase subunit L [Acidimicrobiia bacterium]|nr:NADH-quinone oxidoreductase subunit L [Acidimicrobiia bacterium]
MVDLIWLVPALPLVGFAVLLVAGRRMGEPAAGWFATAMVGASFLTAVVAFIGLGGLEEQVFVQTLFTWMPTGDISIDAGFYLDPLSGVMILFVTGVATLIHMYSIGYMHGDPNFSKFFLYLNLFVFSMLVLVLGDNLLMTFLGWEGVGACSYFLISFWFTKPANASAGKKAFVTNRIGDWGFMVGMFMVLFTFGTLSYSEFLPLAPGLATTTATFIAVMLLIGAIGKSAQMPLFVWLPDAMAGPTPVSALIHAATMVTAGVYLLARINPVLAVSADWVLPLIAWIGAITAFVAATIAVAQNDIKKVLAFSTVSQLGYMFLAIGVGAYWAAIFHMITHAFFKALLFLCAGSVIHGMHEHQDMRVMGALKKFLPITFGAYIVGWLSLAGVPPFSGFFSKDEILAYAFDVNPVLWFIGLAAAGLTAFYMGRQAFTVFWGTPHWHPEEESVEEVPPAVTGTEAEVLADADDPAATSAATVVATAQPAVDVSDLPDDFEPHESPWTMTVPLVVLAVAAAFGGLLNIPLPSSLHFLERWLSPVFELGGPTKLSLSDGSILLLLSVSALVAIGGTLAAAAVYLWHKVPSAPLEPAVLANGWYIDSSITAFMGGPGTAGFQATADVDTKVVDGAVLGVGAGVGRLAQASRYLQSGHVRRYALSVGVGTVVILGFMFTRVVI